MHTPPFVWHLKGRDIGPTVVILAGVHGDELPGLEVLQCLLRYFDLGDKSPGSYHERQLSGQLYLGFGNPEAILKRTRGASKNLDLNRSFRPKLLGRKPGPRDSTDLVRARELAPLLARCDVLIDLHATITPSPPFVYCDRLTEKHREFSSLLPVKHLLTDSFGRFGGTALGSTDAYVDARGGTGLCYEVDHKDVLTSRFAFGGVMNILGYLGLIKPKPFACQDYHHGQTTYTLTKELLAEHAGFSFEPNLNQGFAVVKRGQRIGTYHNRGSSPITSPSDAVLVLQREAGPEIKPGDILGYLAIPFNPPLKK